MSKNNKRFISVLVIVFVAFTVIAFALPFKKNGLFVLSYLFGVIAIALQLYVMKTAFQGKETAKSKVYGIPIARIGLIYAVGQLVLSLIFMALANIAPIWPAVILYVLLLGLAAIGFIAAETAREEIERQEVQIQTDTACMTKLRSMVYPLASQCDDPETKKALENLADEFRYSDPVSSESLKMIEGELELAVLDLKTIVDAGTGDEIIVDCRKVSGLLSERNKLCKLNKKQ